MTLKTTKTTNMILQTNLNNLVRFNMPLINILQTSEIKAIPCVQNLQIPITLSLATIIPVEVLQHLFIT